MTSDQGTLVSALQDEVASNNSQHRRTISVFETVANLPLLKSRELALEPSLWAELVPNVFDYFSIITGSRIEILSARGGNQHQPRRRIQNGGDGTSEIISSLHVAVHGSKFVVMKERIEDLPSEQEVFRTVTFNGRI